MPAVLHRAVPLLAAIALGASLSACGSADESAKPGTTSSPKADKEAEKPSSGDLYKRARASALGAKSGHLVGNLTQKGETVKIELAGTTDGSNQQVTYTRTGSEFTVLTVGGKYWMKGDAPYWNEVGGAEAAKAIGTKWVLVPPAEVKGMDMNSSTLKGLLTEIFADEGMSKLESLTTKVSDGTVSGVAAYVITDKVGEKDANGSIVTSADGKAHLIKLVGPTTEPSELTFSEWDAVKPFTAPAAAEVFTP